MPKPWFLLFFIAFAPLVKAQDALTISPSGYKLKAFYLSMEVTHHWIKGYAVDWETGEAKGPEKENPDKHTHCSAFAAAACQRLNIYLLRPPRHKLLLLANAQFDWLATIEAADAGWLPIKNSDVFKTWMLAQQYANRGFVTVAVYKNKSPEHPGHIALVMPKEITFNRLKDTGPNLIQAGAANADSVALKEGFKHHITAWPETGIAFYYNINNARSR